MWEYTGGISAVTYNPHSEYFASPYSRNEGLGAVREWPHARDLLLLNPIEPAECSCTFWAAAPGVAPKRSRSYPQCLDSGWALLTLLPSTRTASRQHLRQLTRAADSGS